MIRRDGEEALPPCNPHTLAVVDLTVNGEVARLHLASGHLPCAYALLLPPSVVAAEARRFNSFTELRFSMGVVQSSAPTHNLFLSLRFPWGTTHYLGPLTHRVTVSSARFVRDVPSSVVIVVSADWCAPLRLGAPLPSEMLLKEHVKTIIENDEFCGSVAAAHVQNLVRELPFYDAAMQRFRNWSDYIVYFAECYRCWKVVQYEQPEHATLGLSSRTPPCEQRIVANCYAADYLRSDAHRDRVRRSALLEFRGCVAAKGAELDRPSQKGGDAAEPALYIPRKQLRALGSERSFRTLNCVNYLHVLEALPASHLVLFSDLHPVQVSLCASGDTSSEVLLVAAAEARESPSPRCLTDMPRLRRGDHVASGGEGVLA